jgi:hypothetical protein
MNNNMSLEVPGKARDSWKSDAGFFSSGRLIFKATRIVSECLSVGKIVGRDAARGIAQTAFWARFRVQNRVGVIVEEMPGCASSVNMLDVTLCEVTPVGIVVSTLVNDFARDAPFVR